MTTKKRATKKRATKRINSAELKKLKQEIELSQKRINALREKEKNMELEEKIGRKVKNFRFVFNCDVVLDELAIYGCSANIPKISTVEKIQEMLKNDWGSASYIIDEWDLIEHKDNKFKITEVK